jgi:hypothetical protein
MLPGQFKLDLCKWMTDAQNCGMISKLLARRVPANRPVN